MTTSASPPPNPAPASIPAAEPSTPTSGWAFNEDWAATIVGLALLGLVLLGLVPEGLVP